MTIIHLLSKMAWMVFNEEKVVHGVLLCGCIIGIPALIWKFCYSGAFLSSTLLNQIEYDRDWMQSWCYILYL